MHRESGSVRLSALSADTAGGFANFTYPRLAGEVCGLASPWIAIGAWADQDPIGLALGRAAADGNAELTSLFVRPDARCRGVGRQLVAGLTRVLQTQALQPQVLPTRDAPRLTARIGGSNPSRAALERALTSLGWPALVCVETKITGFAGAMAEQGLQLKGVRGLLDGDAVSFDDWNSFDARDVGELDILLAERGFNGGSRNFVDFDGLEPEVSVVIRRAGTAVGWVVGRRSRFPVLQPGSITAIAYSSGYVAPSLARRGVLVGGFWHALTRQAAAYGPSSIATFHTATPRMIALCRRRLAPIALQAEEVFASSYRLR
jgi:GNAT superfamily N-acetyltransferase